MTTKVERRRTNKRKGERCSQSVTNLAKRSVSPHLLFSSGHGAGGAPLRFPVSSSFSPRPIHRFVSFFDSSAPSLSLVRPFVSFSALSERRFAQTSCFLSVSSRHGPSHPLFHLAVPFFRFLGARFPPLLLLLLFFHY